MQHSVDREKAHDWATREELRHCVRRYGVAEKYLRTCMRDVLEA